MHIAALTTVLEVERELEGLLELTVGASGLRPESHREFSESTQAYKQNNRYRLQQCYKKM